MLGATFGACGAGRPPVRGDFRRSPRPSPDLSAFLAIQAMKIAETILPSARDHRDRAGHPPLGCPRARRNRRPASRPETDCRVEEAPPHAAPSSGDRRHCGVALEAVARRGIVRVVEAGCVPIHKRTSDNGVFVRQEGVSTCAAALPYVAGLLAVPAPPAHRPCRSAATGGGGSDPPF